jgi:uracil-DNA glycosylase
MEQMPNLSVILSLGRISHEAVLRATGTALKQASFGHGAVHLLQLNGRTVALLDSYHSSRYNIQTNRLTREMFSEIIASVRPLLASTPRQEQAA